MMTSMHQNLLAAAARLTPWGGLLRRLPLARAHQATVAAKPLPARAMLRVVRIVETDQASVSSGRILMCGRMADVCAELDRMVDREAALLART